MLEGDSWCIYAFNHPSNPKQKLIIHSNLKRSRVSSGSDKSQSSHRISIDKTISQGFHHLDLRVRGPNIGQIVLHIVLWIHTIHEGRSIILKKCSEAKASIWGRDHRPCTTPI